MAMEAPHTKVLVVDDDPDLRQLLADYLNRHGYDTLLAADANDLPERIMRYSPDLLVLDRMLPSGDGADACRRLRERGEDIPVVLLTARDEAVDRIIGLEAGADDYLGKPYAFAELIARVENLGHRAKEAPQATRLKAADLEIDLLTRTVTRAGKPILLQPREFKLLEYLVRNAGHIVTRTMLLENVWDYHFDPQTNVIDVHISRLRAKIDKGHDEPILQTVRGAGYMIRDK